MIKSIVKSASLVLVSLVVFTGCDAEPEPPKAEKEKFDDRCFQDGVLAPNFTCDVYAEGAIVTLGIAKMNAGSDKAYQRTEAMASARDNLARQLETKVSNLFKSFKATTGMGSDATFDKSNSSVSTQLASQNLKGAKQIGRSWRHPKTNELYILVGIPEEAISNDMENAIKTSFKNDKAMYQRFLAAKANGELQKELEKAGK